MPVSVWDSVFLLSHVELHLTRYRSPVRPIRANYKSAQLPIFVAEPVGSNDNNDAD
jgi:hypothetical protein